MKSCQGCKYLRIAFGHGQCFEAIGSEGYIVDPTCGARYYKITYKYGLAWYEISTARLRQSDMPCGPERKLYAPSFFERLRRRIFGEKE